MDGKRKISPKEDFRDWIVDNWEIVEDEIAKSIDATAEEYSANGENFNIKDSVDSDNLLEEISRNIKQGLLNVIDTYKKKREQMRLIDADKLINEIVNTPSNYDDPDFGLSDVCDGATFRQIEILGLIEKQPIVNEWNKLTFRPLTEEEKEEYSNQEWTYMIDGLPDLGEEVLVTDGKRVKNRNKRTFLKVYTKYQSILLTENCLMGNAKN